MNQPSNDLPLPDGIRARMIDNGNGLSMHVLEAGFDAPDRPCIVLLHGFPELAYSWRKVMKPLADAGFHVIAPDQRGYGRTVGGTALFDSDLDEFTFPNLVRDVLGLVSALGYRRVASVIGHDFGSPVAAWCALIRPDVFASVVMMSAPFAGPPAFPFNTAKNDARLARIETAPSVMAEAVAALALLNPPRKHYQWYYSGAQANEDMWHAPQGLAAFLRAYYHVKSADWPGNHPRPLESVTADQLAMLPTYYVMNADATMPQTVAEYMPDEASIAACAWLPDADLQIYASEYERTGFQGGLNWYRCGTDPRFAAASRTWSGRTIDVPACFIAGASDWGYYQRPGDFEAMRVLACTNFRTAHLIEGAGHWVQQEQPSTVVNRILRFLRQDVPPI
ncbi:alpha/beta hydrolase [Caballeronia fortuita]|uniref:Alpha/beta hydrolase n=1 Tax=Caballeronia fortuita TaxID=1777138 RepID=A0A158ACH1_9BURK|nr:alpha/beta hydrolase [Caballeronia fortuita]SAK55552.1 alpha/beta hydrolase [Caballeronia fortuita]